MCGSFPAQLAQAVQAKHGAHLSSDEACQHIQGQQHNSAQYRSAQAYTIRLGLT